MKLMSRVILRRTLQIISSTTKNDHCDKSTAPSTIAPYSGGNKNEDNEVSQPKKVSLKKASDYNWIKNVLEP